MVSTAGGVILAIVILAILGAIGWFGYTQLRARKLGLPPPSLSSYLPWKKKDNPYGPPQPAAGGVVGWFNDQVRKFKNRNNRSAAGAYEPSYGGNGAAADGRRGFGPLDPDEAWDARVGNEADSYGYYEEELGGRPGGSNNEYSGGGSYGMNLAATPGARDEEMGLDDRGRRGNAGSAKNPFDDSHADSLRGVSPRPIADGAGRPTSSGSSERRSVFKENM